MYLRSNIWIYTCSTDQGSAHILVHKNEYFFLQGALLRLSGWTMYTVMVQRSSSVIAIATDGVFITVDTLRTLE